MRKALLIMIFVLGIITCSSAKSESLLMDDFEVPISGGPQGSVDFGFGGGSFVEVTASGDIKYSGSQSLKINYDAVSEGYMWAARGFGLDAKNTAWLVKPEDIQWKKYRSISFYMYGSNSGTNVAFDIKDNGNEMWRFMVEDNFSGWKKINCPFNKFFCRGDWQPDNADKNAVLNFPVKSFQFEPRPVAKGTLYFDCAELN